MKLAPFLANALLTLGLALALPLLAPKSLLAAPARPWLCRDKPVFTAPGPARLVLTRHDARRWQVLLMKFDPEGGHDGFTVMQSFDLAGGQSRLSAEVGGGQYYAVAMYLAGGHWICSQVLQDRPEPGAFEHFCYVSPSDSSCAVTLNALRH